MIKPYFWMKLAYYLGLKIIIKIGNEKQIGYLKISKYCSGRFYLWSKRKSPSRMLMLREIKEVEYVSFFWGCFFSKSSSVKDNTKTENYTRMISELPVSPCVPFDGNIFYLEVPFVEILDTPKPWENKSKKIYR
jgi:hypothetical protein